MNIENVSQLYSTEQKQQYCINHIRFRERSQKLHLHKGHFSLAWKLQEEKGTHENKTEMEVTQLMLT
jgi:hypothetical protein